MTLTKILLPLLLAVSILYLLAVFVPSTENPQPLDDDNPSIKTALSVKKINNVIASQVNNQAERKNSPSQSSSSGQLLTVVRPQWQLTGNLNEHIAELTRKASNGDSVANFVLGMNLQYCFYAPLNETALEQKLAQAAEYSDADLAITNITQRFEYCEGIEAGTRNQFYSYLKNSAEYGEVAAQENIASITPQLYMKVNKYDILERNAYIEQRDNFKKQKYQFLEQAAKHGSIKALSKLSHMSQSQNYGKNGYVNAFAFNQLILELTQSNEIYNRYSWLQEKLRLQLTPEEIESGANIAEQFLKNIEENGTLYLYDN